VIRNRVPLKRDATVATTADGWKQEVVGKRKTAEKYKDATKDLEFLIIPFLNQDLYLGITFWSTFNLLPPSMQVSVFV